MEKHFFLFRHGETTYNVNGLIQGQTNNSVLTERGIKQAYRVGELLKDYPLDILISSPLKRAQQTAEQVLIHFPKLPFKTDNRFTEVNVGEIEGLHYTVVQAKFKEKYNKWRSHDKEYQNIKFDGGESKNEVKNRIFDALNEYTNNTEYSHVAISGHGILLSQMLLSLGHEITDIKNGTILHLTHKNSTWSLHNIIQEDK